MKKWWLIFCLIPAMAANGQFRQAISLPSYHISLPPAPPLKKLPFGLVEDPATNWSYQSPMLTTLPMPDANQQFQTQWVSSVSSLSFNNGKFGTYYYWDIRGNLIDMRGFIDIAGKNKRGIKLVFPWR